MCLVEAGLVLVTSIPRDAVIIRRAGERNITLECEFYLPDGTQRLTVWSFFGRDNRSLEYFSGRYHYTFEGSNLLPPNEREGVRDTYQNRLTLGEFVPEFDGGTVSCMHGALTSNFSLRTYGKYIIINLSFFLLLFCGKSWASVECKQSG